MFYLILLLVLTAVVLTAYVIWRLPEAEQLSRAKKKSAPPALPASRP
jgi:biopolymer transport protein ExbD